MPGNCLPFTVRVGCQVDLSGFFGQDFEFLDHGSFLIGNAVFGGEIVVYIHR
ncbi:hypothetical protein SDC9_164762 [bioreactor metagenome]|uniref:Uncharacterized protein n=1 Tax=bioreactor metagenome TaxID=1076179 RepID=A0A645FV53_9ZZZZ